MAENCVTFMEAFLIFSVSRIRIKYEKYDKGVWNMEEDIYIHIHFIYLNGQYILNMHLYIHIFNEKMAFQRSEKQ